MQKVNLSPFPYSLSISVLSLHFLIFSPFPLHFLILSPFPRSPAARLQQLLQPYFNLPGQNLMLHSSNNLKSYKISVAVSNLAQVSKMAYIVLSQGNARQNISQMCPELTKLLPIISGQQKSRKKGCVGEEGCTFSPSVPSHHQPDNSVISSCML